MKRLLKTTTTAGAALCVLGQPALAELKYENNSGGYVEIYGQLNPSIISVDDGEQTETNLLDNDLSPLPRRLAADSADRGQYLRFPV